MDKDKQDKQNKFIKEAELTKNYNKSYTYRDYLTWDSERKRYEIIDGVIYNMVPAPLSIHQKISMELSRQISTFLIDKKCQVFAAPFDVRLPEGAEDDENIKNVVQPDLVVICNLEKIDRRGCKGAPDFVIEIVSPGSEFKDRKIKKPLYEKMGVKEYWIADYKQEIVEVYISNEDQMYSEPDVYHQEDKIPVSIFEDLEIDLRGIQ